MYFSFIIFANFEYFHCMACITELPDQIVVKPLSSDTPLPRLGTWQGPSDYIEFPVLQAGHGHWSSNPSLAVI